MSSFDLNEIQNQLRNVESDDAGTGVSFAKKSLKLDTAEDASAIVEAIQACPLLEYLDLEGNTLGPHAAKAVAEALEDNGSALKHALWKDMFTGRSKSEIPKSLEYLGNALCNAGSRLYELDLSDNALGPIGIQGLANFLTSDTCYSLRVLRLNNNGLGISGGKMLAKALSVCYDNSTGTGSPPLALKVFVAGRNRLENDGAKALASVFQKLTTLEEVVMPQNGIYHRGITALANGLSSNPGLRVLNLNDNTVGPKGAQAIAKVLPNFQNLEVLNLGDCLLKTKGAITLAKALEVEDNYPFLTKLNLSFNEIHAKAATFIANAVADKERLVSLQLDGNMFGEVGRTVLRDSLQTSEKINSLGTLDEDESDEENETDENEEGLEESEDEEQDEEELDEDEVEDEEEDEDVDEDENEDETEVGAMEEVLRVVVLEEEQNERKENSGRVANGNVTRSTPVSVVEFLKSPTGEKLLLLEKNAVEQFVNEARNLSQNADASPELKFVEEFTKIVMKVSAFSTSGYVDVRSKANHLTDALYFKLCSFAVENGQTSAWNNALLVSLGLIKAEDKKSGKIDWNLEGCFKALEMVSQKNYFLQEMRNTLKLFLERPAKTSRAKAGVDSFQDIKDSLRAVLTHTQSISNNY